MSFSRLRVRRRGGTASPFTESSQSGSGLSIRPKILCSCGWALYRRGNRLERVIERAL